MSEVSSTTPPRPARAFGRWLWALLIFSVSVNLLVIGAVAGAVWHGGPHFGPGGHMRHGGPFGIGHFARKLPQERREVLRAIAEEAREEMRGIRRGAREQRKAVRELLKSEAFDPVRFDAAVSEAVEASAKGHRVAANALKRAVAAMTPDERRAFADMRRRGWRRGGP